MNEVMIMMIFDIEIEAITWFNEQDSVEKGEVELLKYCYKLLYVFHQAKLKTWGA